MNDSTSIDGLRVIPLRRVPDERGTILHMLRADDPHFEQFGEIYFTTIYRNVIKAWHRHRDMTLNYACPVGRVKMVVHDDRDASPTRGRTQEIFLGPDHYALVQVARGLWNGIKGMDDTSLIANCCTHGHDPSRTDRLDPFGDEIPYDWGVRHR